jgi:hypothetical protein
VKCEYCKGSVNWITGSCNVWIDGTRVELSIKSGLCNDTCGGDSRQTGIEAETTR